ncbi:MAG: AAA family ATPase [Bacteroidales bacterium]|jgi:replication factor C small subunit|nr:AAA family ATPase [Bacteroidales bacterium]
MNLHKKLGDDFIWSLKYRPNEIEEIIIPESIKGQFRDVIRDNNVPNMLFYGQAGIGKTTLASVIADTLGRDCLYINGSLETSIDTIRGKLTQFVTTYSFDDNKKLVIYDETDRISPQSMDSIKVFLEEFSKNCSFIFITNHINKIIDPLKSRLQLIEFVYNKKEEVELKKEFAKRVLHILDNEAITYDKKVLAHIINQYFPDMRKCLNELQGKKNRLTDIGILHEFTMDMDSYYEILKKRDFNGIQQFAANVTDCQNFYTKIYESFRGKVELNDIPTLIILANEYAYKSAFVSDKRINIVGFSCEAMNNIKFKE